MRTSHPRTYRGRWQDADLRKGDVVRKANGTRGYRVEAKQGSYMQVRNVMNERIDTWDMWCEIAVVSWVDEDHCVEHAEYEHWCDACIEAKRNCAVKAVSAAIQTPQSKSTTTTDKDAMFDIAVAQVLGGHAGQIVVQIPGKEKEVKWQSEPQKGTKTDEDGVKTTAEQRARYLAEERLDAVLTGLFAD